MKNIKNFFDIFLSIFSSQIDLLAPSSAMPRGQKKHQPSSYPMKLARLLLSVSLISVLGSGCTVLGGAMGESLGGAMGGTVNVYSGPQRPDTEVATIKMSPTLHVPAAMLAKIDDIQLGDELRSYPQAIKILPGTHHLELRCQLYGAHAFPAFSTTVQAGQTYQVNCDDLGDPEHPMIAPLLN